MVKLRMKLEYVNRIGFHPLATVILEFHDNSGWFPLPKDDTVWKALETQHPEIINQIPMYDQTHICGICVITSEVA